MSMNNTELEREAVKNQASAEKIRITMDEGDAIAKGLSLGKDVDTLMSSNLNVIDAHIQVDTEVLTFADGLISELIMSPGWEHPADLRIAIGARVKRFCADRMRAQLAAWLDENYPRGADEQA